MVLGRDCSGVVVAVGRDVSRVEQGEEVTASLPLSCTFIYQTGSYTWGDLLTLFTLIAQSVCGAKRVISWNIILHTCSLSI